ncbi:hypothetical protein [Ruixingdingia sedimenti]|uniref:Uncharacterized protein n=1 Tax=Ruixingdingia sedimenti TaxID=3073604 RepID=A0ABU1FFP5_9RHOB|nr:hypothetical protein [Xinfangfangia sp. LG-4]MDR5655299.1 hypothetical protein [Xinfangfangia sp. LG-4]
MDVEIKRNDGVSAHAAVALLAKLQPHTDRFFAALAAEGIDATPTAMNVASNMVFVEFLCAGYSFFVSVSIEDQANQMLSMHARINGFVHGSQLYFQVKRRGKSREMGGKLASDFKASIARFIDSERRVKRTEGKLIAAGFRKHTSSAFRLYDVVAHVYADGRVMLNSGLIEVEDALRSVGIEDAHYDPDLEEEDAA